MAADHPSRRTKRLKIFEPFVLVGSKGEQRAHLLDISETGALVHCDPCCERGTAIQLGIRGRSLEAQVVWSTPPRMGVTFMRPLSADMVQAFLGQAKAS